MANEDPQRTERTEMRKIGIQSIRVKPLQVSIDYTIRLVRPQRLGGVLAGQPQLVARTLLKRQVRAQAGGVDLHDALAVSEHVLEVAERADRTEPIPRLKAKTPRIHAAVPSAPLGEIGDSKPEQRVEPIEILVGAVEREPVVPAAPELPAGPVAEIPAPQPQRKRRSAGAKTAAEPAAPPPPATRLKVIRRRGEQEPKVFETVTREFPSAMLRGVKAPQDQEQENP